MGCMEHFCNDCGYIVVNNFPDEILCPQCGEVMIRSCDEVPEPREEDGNGNSI